MYRFFSTRIPYRMVEERSQNTEEIEEDVFRLPYSERGCLKRLCIKCRHIIDPQMDEGHQRYTFCMSNGKKVPPVCGSMFKYSPLPVIEKIQYSFLLSDCDRRVVLVFIDQKISCDCEAMLSYILVE
jgi:hypothetical protein